MSGGLSGRRDYLLIEELGFCWDGKFFVLALSIRKRDFVNRFIAQVVMVM